MENQILKLHKEGLLDTEIALIIKKSPDTVAYYRKKLKLINNRNKNSIIKSDKILSLLNQNITVYKISKITGCSSTFINKIAIKNKIKTLTKEEYINNIKMVKNNPFYNLNNSTVKYWLGFLAADGSIYKDRISLFLQEKDLNHIKQYKKFINNNLIIKKVIKDNKYISFGTAFRNKNVVKFLYNIGITNNKSKTLKIKNIKICNDFLRGVIDGDGYIRKNNYEISIVTASKKFAKQLKKAYYNLFGIKAILKEYKKNIYTVSVFKKKEVILILKELYYNADTYLKRKYDTAVLISNS